MKVRYTVSRPKPTILLELSNKKTYKSEQVLEAEAIWAVFYKGKPVNLKTVDLIARSSKKSIAKYKKNSFSNSGHAFNLAEKLNNLFNCKDFEVYKLTIGEKLT